MAAAAAVAMAAEAIAAAVAVDLPALEASYQADCRVRRCVS